MSPDPVDLIMDEVVQNRARKEAEMTAEVKFLRLQCLETEDNGNDEVFLQFDGTNIFGINDIETGQTLDIGVVRNFNGEATVSLFDEDDIDEDDHLGTIVISEEEIDQGVRTQEFTDDEAHYILFYRVRRADPDF
jgi:hypothetical protein